MSRILTDKEKSDVQAEIRVLMRHGLLSAQDQLDLMMNLFKLIDDRISRLELSRIS